MINSSDKPLILAGVEVKRFKLWDQVTALASKARIPIADTILGKSGCIRGRSIIHRLLRWKDRE